MNNHCRVSVLELQGFAETRVSAQAPADAQARSKEPSLLPTFVTLIWTLLFDQYSKNLPLDFKISSLGFCCYFVCILFLLFSERQKPTRLFILFLHFQSTVILISLWELILDKNHQRGTAELCSCSPWFTTLVCSNRYYGEVVNDLVVYCLWRLRAVLCDLVCVCFVQKYKTKQKIVLRFCCFALFLIWPVIWSGLYLSFQALKAYDIVTRCTRSRVGIFCQECLGKKPELYWEPSIFQSRSGNSHVQISISNLGNKFQGFRRKLIVGKFSWLGMKPQSDICLYLSLSAVWGYSGFIFIISMFSAMTQPLLWTGDRNKTQRKEITLWIL